MDSGEIKQLGSDIQNTVNQLSEYLKVAEEKNLKVEFIIRRPNSLTVTEIESIKISKISYSVEHEFNNENKNEEKW